MKKFIIMFGVTIISILLIVNTINYFGLKRENIKFSSNNKDVNISYDIARKRAAQWHSNAYLVDLVIEINPNNKETLFAYFVGKGFFSRFSDKAEITVDIKEKNIISFDIEKGSIEPNYDDNFPMTTIIKHRWKELLEYADNKVGNRFIKDNPEVTRYFIFQNNQRVIVRYLSKITSRFTNVNLDDEMLNLSIEEGNLPSLRQ